jgi:predicted small lipoprotein YifL
MLNVLQILVSDHGRDLHRVCRGRHTARASMFAAVLCAASLVVLSGCGQRGPLYLSKDAAAKNRATLPDLLTPRLPGSTDAPIATPATPEPRGTEATPGATGTRATTTTPGSPETSETTK